MENTKNLEVLRNLGLSEQEIAAYTALLTFGSSNATKLAKEMNIKRTTIYPILKRLIEQNIVTEYKQGKKSVFTPIRPNKLVSNFENKVRKLLEIVPFLENMQSKNTHEYGVRFLQSKKELKSFYENILDDYKNDEYCVIGSATTWINMDRDFFLDYRKRRAQRNIKVKLLLSSDSKTEEGQDDPSLLREYKYLPEKYNFKSTIDIYKDRVVIVGPDVKALAVIIAIPPMVDIFKIMFEYMWNKE